MCFTGGHDERDVYASEYLQLRIAISRNVVKLRQNKVHLSELWWQVARVTNPRLINNSLQWSLLSSAQWRVHHPSGHRGNYSLQRIRIYIKAQDKWMHQHLWCNFKRSIKLTLCFRFGLHFAIREVLRRIKTPFQFRVSELFSAFPTAYLTHGSVLQPRLPESEKLRNNI